VSESVTQNELNAIQIAIFPRSSPNRPSWYSIPGDVITYCFWWKSVKPELELIFTARRSYASAVLGVVILSVCPSVCHTRVL